MAVYELMVLTASPTEGGGDLEALQKSVTAVVTKFKGKVVSQEELGEKQLAYQINHATQGTYVVYQIELPETEVKSVNKRLLNEKIIWRYLLTKVVEKH